MRASYIRAVPDQTISSEEDALILSAQKNPVLFQHLYDRWAVPVYQYFYHRVNDSAQAEDLTAQTFLAAYQALPRYQHRGHFSAWLFTIARNQVRDYYRKAKREISLDAAQQQRSLSDPAAEVMQDDEIRRLIQIVRALPEEQQELIRLRYVANLSFADMAIILGKHESAVKKALYRLQERLNRQLEDSHEA